MEFFRDTLKVPVFRFPEEAVRALAWSRDRAARGALEVLAPISPLPGAAKISGLLAQARDEFLPLPLALSVVEALGVPVAPWRAATARKRPSRPPRPWATPWS